MTTDLFPESIVDGSKYYSTVIKESLSADLITYLENAELAILCELESESPTLAGWEAWEGRGGSMCVWAMLIASELKLRGETGADEKHKSLVAIQYILAGTGSSFITPDLFLKNSVATPVEVNHLDELFCWCDGSLSYAPLDDMPGLQSLYIHRDCGRPHRVWAKAAANFYPKSNTFVGGPFSGHEMDFKEINRLDSLGKIKNYKITAEVEDNLMSGEELHVWRFTG